MTHNLERCKTDRRIKSRELRGGGSWLTTAAADGYMLWMVADVDCDCGLVPDRER